jgi:hypothetical protein
VTREKSEIGATTIQIMKAYKVEKLIVSSLELFPHFNFKKRIVSAETIRGNTVCHFAPYYSLIFKSTDVFFDSLFE